MMRWQQQASVPPSG